MKKTFKITPELARELLNLPIDSNEDSFRTAAGRVEFVTQLLEGIEYEDEGDLNPPCVHPMGARYKSIDGIRMGCLACDKWDIE